MRSIKSMQREVQLANFRSSMMHIAGMMLGAIIYAMLFAWAWNKAASKFIPTLPETYHSLSTVEALCAIVIIYLPLSLIRYSVSRG